MNVISLKEYAKNNHISYEAVRQQVVRYAEELGEHIVKDGRQQFLDEEAVAFLDGKRQKNPVVIYQANKDEEIERLENQNKELLIEIANLQKQLLKVQEQNHQLHLESGKMQLLQAENDAVKQRAEQAEERARAAEQDRVAVEEALEQMRKEAKMRADEAQVAEEQRIDAERQVAEKDREIEERDQKIEEYQNAGFFKRLFGWKK